MVSNILLLAMCQALMLSAISLTMTSSALVGLEISPRESLATMPLAFCYVTVMLMLIPASLFMQRFGRKAGFFVGAICGVFAGIFAGLGIYTSNFILFCVASIFQGVAMSSAQFYRFAAAEVAMEDYKSRAISWVLAGGLIAAFLGPSIARYTRESFTGPGFSASFGSIAILSVGVLICVAFLQIPDIKIEKYDEPSRRLTAIMTLPTFIVAVLCTMIAYGSMNLLMTSTPLAMNHLHMNFNDTATVIQWHIVGMFAPSFFTGSLIHRFGVLGVMFAGTLLLIGCVLTSIYGNSYGHFLGALIVLGIGWNFLYVGGTTLLTEVYRPSEKGAVQGINDFLVFTAVAMTALGSGYIHHTIGWEKLNLLTTPVLVLSAVSIMYLGFSQKRRRL